ncbi:MAG TPA: hypothetical protein PLB81_05980, partial [Deltaproteobacteria bacterium]|nr:hypothetical protein [Deltaproteobacteria bacterium]
MSLAIIDARQWQNLFDLRTGAKREDDRPETRIVRDVLARHPYPGDVENASNAWVTDTALDLIDKYQPQLACLCYAHQYFVSRYNPLADSERQALFKAVFEEVRRFVDASGYTPLIIGTGDMRAVAGEMDLSRLEGLAISSHWSARYAGLHQATPGDLAYVRGLDNVERVVSRQEWISLFPGVDYTLERIPEYLLIAREGWTFRTTGTPLRKSVMIPATSAVPAAMPKPCARPFCA